MISRHALRAFLLILSASLAACSTPAPVRELAGRGASTVGLAEASLRNYLTKTEAQLTSRSEFLRDDAEQLARERLRRETNQLYAEAAKVPKDDSGPKLIRSMATLRKEQREKLQKDLEKITAANAFDRNTLAKVPSEKLAAAKKSFVVLSEELSPSQWVTLVGGYAKVISDGIEKLDSSADKPAGNGQ